MTLFNLRDSAPDDRPSPPACSVLIIVKDEASAAHKFSIANVGGMVQALRDKTACSVERATWAGMSLKSQVSAIYDRRIVVSLMGADLMNCIFQPLGAVRLVRRDGRPEPLRHGPGRQLNLKKINNTA